MVLGLCVIFTLLAVFPPFGVPGFAFALGGAAVLVGFGLLPLAVAAVGVARSVDVCCFLSGMMLLAELCRQEGVFATIAGHAARLAGGSASRLFGLVFLVGILVTALLSNDATVVVLTPAVAAIARAAGMEKPAPLLFACAFVANAGSFVLPIANPANLVLYGQQMPSLLPWLAHYSLPSAGALLMTYLGLRLTQRAALAAPMASVIEAPRLSLPGVMAALGTCGTAALMLAWSASGRPFGPVTLAAALGTALLVWLRSEMPPGRTLRHIAWGVLPLVVGLFVMVTAVDRTGLTGTLAARLAPLATAAPLRAGAAVLGLVTLASNIANNLPVGLLTGQVLAATALPHQVREAALIGVDLGPNFSVTGSLATILWLTALKRDGYAITSGQFLRIGAIITPPALALALAGLALS